MATMTTSSPCKEAKPKTPPPPDKCCTSIECIEKPRFFCGQLLTDLDLEAAMSYVSAKSRLHNRHLFGAGVVCGLTVTCDPCNPGSVIVETGYALDCLGNDIVVCAPAVFNVKEALDCKRKKEEADCNSRHVRIPKECETPETEYCLVISYAEKPAKPVNALAHDQGCRTTGRCESSRTLETYRLDLLDEKSAKNANVFPDVWSRIRACLQDDMAKMTAFTRELAAVEKMDAARSAEALPKVYGRLRAAILEHAERIGLTHCDLIDKVCAIDKKFRLAQSDIAAPIEQPDTPAVNRAVNPVGIAPAVQTLAPVRALSALYLQLLIDCVCAALQLPCGECCEPEHVLLACLKVRDGNVVSICNTVRTQVISGLSVRYWLQPLFGQLQKLLERFCCDFDPARLFREEVGFAGVASHQSRSMAGATLASRYASSLFDQLQAAATPTPIPADALPSPFDLYLQPANDAQERLAKAGIRATFTRAETNEDAYSVQNLSRLAFKLQRDSVVELVVGPDNLVSAIRVAKGPS